MSISDYYLVSLTRITRNYCTTELAIWSGKRLKEHLEKQHAMWFEVATGTYSPPGGTFADVEKVRVDQVFALGEAENLARIRLHPLCHACGGSGADESSEIGRCELCRGGGYVIEEDA